MSKKIVIAKVCDDGRQKRLTIPKQDETEDWKQGDIVKINKVELE